MLTRLGGYEAPDKSTDRQAALESYRDIVGELYPHHEDDKRRVPVPEMACLYSGLENGEQLRDISHRISGRVVAKRQAGSKLVFYTVSSGQGHVQVVASRKNSEDDAETFAAVHNAVRRGTHIDAVGHPGKTKVGEVSLFATGMRITAPCLHDLPLQLTDPDIRMRNRSLDMLVNPSLASTLRTRAKVLQFVRRFLDERDFVEVETPVLTPQAGGASARPFETHAAAIDRDMVLRIAPELYLKQLVIGGLDRVYELGRVFRNEGLDPTHNPEFTTCEFYQAYCSFDELMATTEELVGGMVAALRGTSKVTVDGDDGSGPVEVSFEAPFAVLPFLATLEAGLGQPVPDPDADGAVARLLDMCAVHGLSVDPPHTYAGLLDRLAGKFVEPLCIQPTFVTDHPACLSPLAKSHPTDAALTSRFELFVNGKEICNAYVELNDPEEQRRRFAQQLEARKLGDDEASLPDEGFCTSMEYGLPPTVGWGMGIDRMVMLLAEVDTIRDVLAFPMHRSK